MAKISRIFLFISVFFALLGAGCKAQTSSAAAGGVPAEVAQRIKNEIRSRYNVPPQIDISLSEPKPADFPGYDTVVVTFTGGSRTTSHDFLLSKDRKTLAHLEKIDISHDLMSKIDVKGRPERGNANAKVTIVNYDDFQCPYCSRMHAVLFPNLLKQYGDRVRFIYKDYPLVEIHPWAMHAAIDANCLGDQNSEAYWEFADYVHANQKLVAGANPGEAFANLDRQASQEAEKHHLDVQKVNACMKKSDESGVRASMAEGDKLGVDATPTMFINGERVSGLVPEEEMRSIIDRALVAAGEKAPTTNAKN